MLPPSVQSTIHAEGMHAVSGLRFDQGAVRFKLTRVRCGLPTIRKLGSDWVTTSAFSVSLSIALRRRKSYERLQCGLLAHLVLERRCKAVPRDAVTQGKERTLDSHVQ
jgi:hypothetical protein